jgi:hypothetical protein
MWPRLCLCLCLCLCLHYLHISNIEYRIIVYAYQIYRKFKCLSLRFLVYGLCVRVDYRQCLHAADSQLGHFFAFIVHAYWSLSLHASACA